MSEETQVETATSGQATPESDPSDVQAASAGASAGQAEPAPAEEPKPAGAPAEPAREEPKAGEPKEEPRPEDQPITDWSKVKLDLPQGAPIDQGTVDAFGKTAVELGLTPSQANRLVNFQLEQIAAARERAFDAGTKALNAEWGAKFSENSQAVLTLIANVDRDLGGSGTEFSKALELSGATLYPAVCKGLLALAKATSEDTIGKGGAAAQAEHEETALEGLQNALAEAKRR